MNAPIRIQLSRKPGWRIPPNTVVVSRPSIYGNPLRVIGKVTPARAVEAYEQRLMRTAHGMKLLAQAREELRGKNLACWCPHGQSCHADVLLRLVNCKNMEIADACELDDEQPKHHEINAYERTASPGTD